MAHHTNLISKIVSIQPLVVKLEGLLQTTYKYFFFTKFFFEHGSLAKLKV
jgi:hypothetical protein